MKKVSVADFKAHFSDFLKDVSRGEEIAIEYGRRKEVVAVLGPPRKFARPTKRPLGLLKGKATFKLGADYLMTDEEFLAG